MRNSEYYDSEDDWSDSNEGLRLEEAAPAKRRAKQGTWPTPEVAQDARLMAMAFVADTHVIAIIRDEASARGRVTFRKYDNDSDARRRGTFERVSARQLWVGSCEVTALTPRDSALHRAVAEARPKGSLAEQRLAELRVVLGGAGLAALATSLQRAKISTLASLKYLTIEQLQEKLATAGAAALSAAQLQQLRARDLCKAPSQAPRRQRMERD